MATKTSIKMVSENALHMTKNPEPKEYPETLRHKKETFIYGTCIDKGPAVYYRKSWFYSA